jgi:hypothetical protein
VKRTVKNSQSDYAAGFLADIEALDAESRKTKPPR